MATKIIKGVESKQCTGCGRWKPCSEFPNDTSHGPKQCFTHCRCKACHRKGQS